MQRVSYKRGIGENCETVTHVCQTCHAQDLLAVFLYFYTGPGGPIISPERRFIVDVNSSKPVIAPIGANVTTVVNATVIMTCPSQGSPQPTVTWNHDQQFVVPGGRYSMNESSLVISGVRLEDAGKYQCTASNRFGRDVESLSLTVTGNVTAL